MRQLDAALNAVFDCLKSGFACLPQSAKFQVMKIFLDPMRFCVCMFLCVPLCEASFVVKVTHAAALNDVGYGVANYNGTNACHTFSGIELRLMADASYAGSVANPGGGGITGLEYDENGVLLAVSQSGGSIYWHQGGGIWNTKDNISSTGARAITMDADNYYVLNGSGNAIDVYSRTNTLVKGTIDISSQSPAAWDISYMSVSNSIAIVNGDDKIDIAYLNGDKNGIIKWESLDTTGLGTTMMTGITYDESNKKFGIGESFSELRIGEVMSANGTPYSWLIDHGLSGDTTDPDFDGFLTWQEYICDTIPTDSNSFLSVSITGTELSFDSSSNCLYGIDSKGSMGSNTWNTLTNNLPGSGSTMTLAATNSAPCFFRLNAERR